MPGQSSKARWVIWFLAVLFYFYEYLLRISPSVMVKELITAFHVDAAALGTLSAFYFWSYAPMQLPAGMLMDRFGARRLLSLATAVCGLGAILFGFSPDLWVAEAGRLFMGFGSAFAFVGLVYVSSHWFAGSKLALLIGLGNSLGMLGAVMGEGPLSLPVDAFGWRGAMMVLGVGGLILAVINYVAIKGAPLTRKTRTEGIHVLWSNLKLVCSNGQTWLNGLVALCFLATTNSFAGLWSVPFLQDTHHMSKATAGFATSTFFLGWIVGGPIIGHVSDRLSQRKPMLIASSLLALFVILPIIYVPHLGSTTIFALLFFTGLFGSGQLLTYSVAIEINPPVAKGTAAAFTNLLVFLFAAILQPFVGYLLDLTGNYRLALTAFPATLLIAAIAALFLKENYHRSHHA